MLILLARIDQELNPGGDDLRRVLRNVAWCMRPQNVCEDSSLGWDSKQIPPEEVRFLPQCCTSVVLFYFARI